MSRLPSPQSLRRRLLKHLTEVEERLYRAVCEGGEVPDPSLAREMRQYAAQVLEVLRVPEAVEPAPGGITLEDLRRAFEAAQTDEQVQAEVQQGQFGGASLIGLPEER